MVGPDRQARDLYTVSRLNAEARAVLEGSFALLWVEGEISNLVAPRSGHLYFSLKDAHAQVRCALFRAKRLLLRMVPANGLQVIARVRVSFYEPRGDFQLIVEHIEPAGAGSAQRAFEALKQRLHAEGLFDAARKRELPTFPRRLGIITSPSGAAIRDVLQVLRRRAPALAVTLFPAQVQGQDAPAELREALAVALRRADCDVLLLTRGGGSIEDLAAFNDEQLARAIAAAEIPVVSAVGHEIDFTISDFVADRRAPTPSAAAELISPDTPALLEHLARQQSRLARALRRQCALATERLARLDGRLRRAAPLMRLRQQEQRLDGLDLRLSRAVHATLARRAGDVELLTQRLHRQTPRHRLQVLRQRYDGMPARLVAAWRRAAGQRAQRLEAALRQLHGVSPQATIKRGYAILRRPDSGPVVTSVRDVAGNDRLEAVLADGRLELDVIRVRPDD